MYEFYKYHRQIHFAFVYTAQRKVEITISIATTSLQRGFNGTSQIIDKAMTISLLNYKFHFKNCSGFLPK